MRSRRAVLSAIGQEAAGFGGRGGNPAAGVGAAISPALRSLPAAGLADYAAPLSADAPRSFWLTALRLGVTMYFTDLPHFLDSTAVIGPVKEHPRVVHSSTSRTGKAACGLARRFRTDRGRRTP